MEHNIDYRFDSSTGIFYKNYHGKISLSDIILSWEKTIEQGLIPKNTKGFIVDYRDASFCLQIEDHVGIANFYRKYLDIFGGLRIAVLMESSSDIVIPYLVETLDEGYSTKTFTSQAAAIKWVLG